MRADLAMLVAAVAVFAVQDAVSAEEFVVPAHWRRRASRLGLSDSSAGARQLQGTGQCRWSVMQTLTPASFNAWEACVEAKQAVVDWTVAGMDVAVESECWCEHNMSQAIEALGCCSTELWKPFCELDCDADCTTAAAQTCIEQCPPLCLETYYAPEECTATCDEHNCHVYKLCITEHAKNETANGNLDRVCHDSQWENSQQLQDYSHCVASMPQRTYWNYKNAYHYCLCEADVRTATVDSLCCGAEWAEAICNESTCPSSAFCETEEARRCARECSETCGNIVFPTAACAEKCLRADSPCATYQYCAPLEHATFDYICDNGTQPDERGCCDRASGQHSKSCPALCDGRVAWILQHGTECVCQGCPRTEEEQTQKLDEVIRPAVESEAEAYLQDIVTSAGIEYPTESMRRKMEMRNAAILSAYESYPHDPARLQLEISRLNNHWLTQIAADAERCKAMGTSCYQVSGNEAEKSGNEAEESDFLVLTIVLSLLGVLFFSCCCIAFFVVKAKKNPVNGPTTTDGTTMQQGNGEGVDGIILGKPVAPEGEAAAGAVVGMPPTAPGQAAGKDPDAATDANGLFAIGHPVPGHTPDAEKAQVETQG